MNKWMAAAMTAMVVAGAPLAHASTHSASMDVTFRIQEACAISSADNGRDARVSCQYRTPYRIVARDAAPASSSAQDTAARRTEHPADTDAPAALTVFF